MLRIVVWLMEGIIVFKKRFDDSINNERTILYCAAAMVMFWK